MKVEGGGKGRSGNDTDTKDATQREIQREWIQYKRCKAGNLHIADLVKP